jgi:diacylglycerol O-acyltransferase
MATQPMSPVDAAWFHMDGPVNLAVVTSLLVTRKPLDFERVRAVFTERLAPFARFRQRVVERGFAVATPHWQDVPDFSIEQNLHHVALPEPHDRAALTAMVEDLASTPLDRERPLWQVYVVDGVGGGSALVMRVHHCIADGTAMVAVCQRLFDSTSRWRRRVGRAADDAAAEPGLVDRLFAPAFEIAEASARALRSGIDHAVEIATHPQRVMVQAALLLGGAGMLAGELLKKPDPKSPLKGEFGMKKRVAWSAPVALGDVRAIGAPMGAKINDVLVAGMSGALRTYLAKRGVDVAHTTVRAMVPVDLRPPERATELGNEFGLVILELAVRNRDPWQRLRVTKERMDALKHSPEAAATMALFEIFGRGPKPVEDLAVDLFGTKASVVMTNVVGPQKTMYLAGVPIDRMMFWVPHPGRQLGMGISILSYDGAASLAVVADGALVPDPEAITEQFNREFARMLDDVRSGKPAGVVAGSASKSRAGQRSPQAKARARSSK